MVTVGSWVTVSEGSGEESYRIVPEDEADPMNLAISEASPLGRALLGHRPGDTVRVRGSQCDRTVVLVSVADQG